MLEDLNDGLVSPVFDCPRQSNALSTNIWSERAVAVLVVEALCLLGARPRAAAKRVISNMSLDVSEADVLSWRSEFKKDKVKNREARALYQMEMEAAQGMDRSKLENDMKRMFDDGIREYWGIVPPASPAAGE